MKCKGGSNDKSYLRRHKTPGHQGQANLLGGVLCGSGRAQASGLEPAGGPPRGGSSAGRHILSTLTCPTRQLGGIATLGQVLAACGPGTFLYFQRPSEAAGKCLQQHGVRPQGKVTVKYDCKELQPGGMDPEQLPPQKEEIAGLETVVERWVKELLGDSYKPTEAFVSGLLVRSWTCRSLNTPQK